MNEAFDQVMGYALAVWRKRWVVLVIAWLVAVVGWVWVYTLENRYEAQARVYVDTQSLLRPLMSGMAVQPNVEQQVAMVTRTLASRPNLEKVARMTDLDLRAKTPKQQEELYTELAKAISLQGTNRENLYTIAYQHANPDLARRVVQALLTIFTESSLGGARKDISNTQKFIEDQLKSYEARLLEKEKEVEEFKRRNVGTMPGQGGDFYSKLSQISVALEQAKLELDEAANRKKQLQQQLEDQEEVLVSPAPGPAPVTATTTALDGRIAALQGQLDNLRLRYTDVHPDIGRTKQLIARLQEQKKQEEEAFKAQFKEQPQSTLKAQNPIYQQLTIAIAEADANLASLKARVAQMERKRADLYRAVDRIPQIESEYTQLTRDLEIYKQKYSEMLARRETASLSGEVESKTDIVDFRVVDPPRVPNKPAWPNRPLLVSVVPLGGIGAGLALAFLLTQLRPTVDSRRQLRDLSNVPLLGMVTMIETDASRRKARRGILLFGAGALALGLALIAQLIYYLVLSPAA
ncbi:MAG: chain length-determining protein [Betaproteobacteria bacterium]|nr:chain length-determining protein [Betaproteobacteria bacterium]